MTQHKNANPFLLFFFLVISSESNQDPNYYEFINGLRRTNLERQVLDEGLEVV